MLPKNYEIYLLSKCANCCISIDSANANYATKLRVLSSKENSTEFQELSNIEAISFIYGIATVKLTYNLLRQLKDLLTPEDYKTMSTDLLSDFEAPVKPSLGLCRDCAPMLEEMYVSHKNFYKKSHLKSFISKSLKIPDGNLNNSYSCENGESCSNLLDESSNIKFEMIDNYENYIRDENISRASFSTNRNRVVESSISAKSGGDNNVEDDLNWEDLPDGQNGLEIGESGAVNVVGGIKQELETDEDADSSHDDHTSVEPHPENAIYEKFDCAFSDERKFENENDVLQPDHQIGRGVRGTNLKSYQCHRCRAEFCNRQDLFEHGLRFHELRLSLEKVRLPQSNIRCMFCGLFLFNYTELKSHEKSVQIDGKRELLGCKNSIGIFSNIKVVNGYIYEMEFESENDQDYSIFPDPIYGSPFRCPKCSKEFQSHFSVKKHCRREHKLLLPTHTLRESGRLDCNIAFKSRHYIMREHVRSIHGSNSSTSYNSNAKSVSCSKCNKSFTNITILRKHYRFVHDKLYVCQETKLRDLHESPEILALQEFVTPEVSKMSVSTVASSNKEYSRKSTIIATVEDTGVTGVPASEYSKEVKGPPFQCPKCEESYQSYLILRKHCRKNHNLLLREQQRPRCSECNTSFNTKGTLRTHLKNVHNSKVESSDVNTYKNHSITEKLQNKNSDNSTNVKLPKMGSITELTTTSVIAEYSNISFSEHTAAYAEFLTDPSQSHKPYFCRECKANFSTLRVISEHNELKHNGRINFSCKNCDMDFEIAGSLITHYLRSHNEQFAKPKKEFKCLDCFKFYTTIRTRKLHMKTHHPLFNSTCETCYKSFSSKWALRAHTHQAHPNDQVATDRFKCKICDKTYKNKYNLQVHVEAVHEEVKQAKCTVCQKEFYGLQTLKVHMRIHSKVKPFNCKYCEKTFTTRGAAVFHETSHVEARPYNCKVCRKSFKASSALSSHQKVHNNHKAHVCEKCGAGFKRRAPFNHHMTDHTNEEQGILLSCNKCGKTYKNLASLLGHNVEVHPKNGRVKQYICDICGKIFKRNHHLTRHLGVHNKNNLSSTNITKTNKETSADISEQMSAPNRIIGPLANDNELTRENSSNVYTKLANSHPDYFSASTFINL